MKLEWAFHEMKSFYVRILIGRVGSVHKYESCLVALPPPHVQVEVEFEGGAGDEGDGAP